MPLKLEGYTCDQCDTIVITSPIAADVLKVALFELPEKAKLYIYCPVCNGGLTLLRHAYAKLAVRSKVQDYLSNLAAFNQLHEKQFDMINEAFDVDCKEICEAYGITYKRGG